MKRDLYAEVSARIVAELEAGAAPWIKPWSSTPGANTPCNAVTNRPYSGCNVILLWMAQAAGYRTPRFLTFKQALDLGGHVRKGERGTKVYFVKQLEIREDADDAASTRLVPMLREYTVFNVDQCDGLPDSVKTRKPLRVRNPDTRDELADEFLRSTGADIREGHGEAYYVPSRNFISMPAFEAFKSADHFYNVAFHELTHWTAHGSRLDRDLKNRFGSRNYAAEELIAELGAAFLCAEFGFDGNLRHAGYIAHWIELLRADNRLQSSVKGCGLPAGAGACGAVESGGMTLSRRASKYEPIFDVDPVTGVSIEVFYADRTLETFGWRKAGWFRQLRRRGFAPNGPAHGPFPSSYSAYRNALLAKGFGARCCLAGGRQLRLTLEAGCVDPCA